MTSRDVICIELMELHFFVLGLESITEDVRESGWPNGTFCHLPRVCVWCGSMFFSLLKAKSICAIP